MLRNLVGLHLSETGEHIRIQPYFARGLDYVAGAIDTIYGEASLAWRKKSDRIYEVHIHLPIGMKLNYLIKCSPAGGNRVTEQDISIGYTNFKIWYNDEAAYSRYDRK